MVYWKVQLIDNKYPNRKKYTQTIFFSRKDAFTFKNSYSQKMKEAYTFKVMRFEGDGHKVIDKWFRE